MMMATNGVYEDAEAEVVREVTRCNICGSIEYKVLYKETEAQIHQIVKCTNCGLMYAFPLGKQNITKYYVKEEDTQQYMWATPQVHHAKIKAKDYEDIDSYLGRYFPERGKLLEVGSSTGIFLDYMRGRGWDVIGIEPNGSAVNFAKEVFGIETHQATLESAPLSEASVEAAVMLHVIEHVDNPAAAVNSVCHLLRPGGIFVVETPTFDSFAFRLLGRRERSIRCDGHIFFFTVNTLSDLLERHGFRILEWKKVGRTLSLERLLWNIGVISKSERVQRLLGKISENMKLQDKLIHVNARDMVRIYCRKK